MYGLLAACLCAAAPTPVEVYDVFQWAADGPTTTFTHADGTTVTVSSFDDGLKSWVRFMPTKPGEWKHAGGVVTAVNARRKGPIRVDAKHPHHFVWEGTGEHVFLNGMTTYWLLGVQDDKKIEAAIDRLAKTKINRIRVALNARTSSGERWFEPQVKNSDQFKFRIDPWVNKNPDDPKKPDFDLTKFDVQLWQKLDRLVKYARDRDVLVSIIFHLDGADEGVDPFGGGKAGMKTYTGGEAEWNYYRYAAARLGAYSNVMWDLTNEWHLFRSAEWVNNAGKVLRDADPYKHLMSVHGRGDFPFYKSEWADFALYQEWDDGGGYAFLRDRRKDGDKVRPMPHVNEEYGYEDHYPGAWGGGKKKPARAAADRAGLAWDMGMAGGYQTTGERADVAGQGGWITGLGNDEMKLPELHKHLAVFFTSFEWWRCDPVPTDEMADGGARVLAAADRKTVAVYLPQGKPATVKLAGEYRARWFDPRTGQWGEPTAATGEWKATPPGEGNWAVLLEAKSLLAAREELLAAARKGDVAEVTKLLDAGVSPNCRSEYGATPLHYAADKGHVEVSKLLLARGANPAAVDDFYGATPLTWAGSRERVEVVGMLLRTGLPGTDAWLRSAAQEGNAAMVKTVLADGRPTAKGLDAALKAATNKEVEGLLTVAGAKPSAAPAAKAEDLSAYAGTFRGSNDVEVKLVAQPTGIRVEADGRRLLTLIRDKDETFKSDDEDNPWVATFVREGDKVVKFTRKREGAPDVTYTRSAAKPTADTVTVAKDVTDPTPDVKTPANWPQFRGVGAAGVADGQFPPTTFDVPKGKNVRWKTPIPGLGHSCPVVWGDKLFITTAVGDPKATLRPGQYGDVDSVKEEVEHEFRVMCLDKNTGKVLWDELAHKGVPAVKRHLKGTHANSTVATDGTNLVVCFGAEGLFCYDLAGKQKWKRSLGKLDSGWFFDPDYQWGFGSSPVVHDGKAFVQVDAGKTSFVAAYDLKDGGEVWRTEREEVPSWGSPTVVVGKDRTEVVCTGTKFARGYDVANGKELWRVGRLSEISVPTPFFAEGRIFVTSGYRPAQPIFAIEPGATGDLTPKGDTKPKGLAWFAKTGGPYMPTPLAYQGGLYVLSNSGMLTRYDAATGKKGYTERIGGGSGYTSALVAADGRLYCVGETDGVRVVKTGPEFELLAVNPVGETCMATPAISDGALFLRTEKHLVALSVKK